MAKRMQCAACGNPSKSFLFKDETLGIPICSRKCEYEYLKNLSSGAAEHTIVVQYLDSKIKNYKKRNRIGWGLSGAGALLMLIGVLIPDVSTFIAGVIVAFLSAVTTRHFEDTVRKLTIKRKKLAI
jgi:tartrate dehydratase alpha subunit/fumarate hydratase class I-like protein